MAPLTRHAHATGDQAVPITAPGPVKQAAHHEKGLRRSRQSVTSAGAAGACRMYRSKRAAHVSVDPSAAY